MQLVYNKNQNWLRRSETIDIKRVRKYVWTKTTTIYHYCLKHFLNKLQTQKKNQRYVVWFSNLPINFLHNLFYHVWSKKKIRIMKKNDKLYTFIGIVFKQKIFYKKLLTYLLKFPAIIWTLCVRTVMFLFNSI